MALDLIKNIFNWILPISLFVSLFYFTTRVDTNRIPDDSTCPKENSKLRAAEAIMAFIIFFSILLIIVFRYKNLAWIAIVLCSPAFLGRLVETYDSLGIIGKVVQSNSSNQLSAKEHLAIDTFALVFWFFCNSQLPAIIMERAITIENTIISDLAYVVLYTSLLFLYTFLSCALLPIPLLLLSKLLIKLNSLLHKHTKLFVLEDFFIQRIEKPGNMPSLIVKHMDDIVRSHGLLHIAKKMILPFLFIFDVIIIIIEMILSFLLTAAGYFFLLLKMVRHTIGKFVTRINNLSDRRLVVTAFRVGLIVALTVTVITNRYEPFFKNYDESTSVLEFVASTILIPVIFEWISSMSSSKQ